MRVVVIGGSGVFGSRLAEMACRDGHDVWLAGRRAAPLRAVAARIGADVLVLDRAGDLTPLWALAPDVVIDAAGPFHAYGADPYRIAQGAIDYGVHYLDLADDADFCSGISALDDAARAAGVFVLSGASSVPGLSSTVVAGLAQDADEIDAVASAILPGNRAPRGAAVVASILHQVGRPFAQTIAGAQVRAFGWSDRRVFRLAKDMVRAGYAIRVPDQVLFPAHFKARSVTFHAGTELWLTDRGLAGLARLRRWLGLRLPDRLILWGARALSLFGSDRGGMVVQVIWRRGGAWQCSDWVLEVRDGQGPFIPGIVARAVLRDPSAIAPGARAALAPVTLEQVTAAMSDLAAVTHVETREIKPLFETVLRSDFARLPYRVCASHAVYGPRLLRGTARVTRGTAPFGRLIAALFGFPPAAEDVPVSVLKEPVAGGELWTRRFGNRVFRSVLRRTQDGMSETFWPFTFDLDLHVAQGALHFPVRRGRFLGIPLPKWMLPRSVAAETEVDGAFRFDVALYAPITGDLIVHYQGTLDVT